MIKYIITSEAFEGEAILTYDENGDRPMCDCYNTNVRADQHRWLLRWICRTAIDYGSLAAALKDCAPLNLKFRQVVFEPTFVEFWAAYFRGRYKDNSSKKKAETRWNKMSKGAQVEAYNYIGKYFSQIPEGVQTKLAETYLWSEVWVK